MPPVPVVRVEGHRADGGWSVTLEDLVAAGHLQRAAKRDVAKEAEAALELGDVLYFYVGFASPNFGDMVFAYHPEMTTAHTGSATHFDTGGFHLGLVHRADSSARLPIQYLRDHRVPLTDWRSAFGSWLSEYFASASAYVTGQRARDDDPSGRLLHPDNKRPAWTWELQILEDHNLGASLRQAFFMHEVHEELQRLSENAYQPAVRLMATVLLANSESVIAHDGSGVCQRAEQVMATWK